MTLEDRLKKLEEAYDLSRQDDLVTDRDKLFHAIDLVKDVWKNLGNTKGQIRNSGHLKEAITRIRKVVSKL